MMKEIILHVKNRSPLIHHMTNDVVVNFTANGVLAFGASPIMAKEITEVAEMAMIADGLLLNIGTATREEIDAMVLAGTAANKKGIPVVLDPVGVTASHFRQQAVKRLLATVDVTAVKGNAGEIAYLAGMSLEARGVDAAEQPVAALQDVAVAAANKLGLLVIVTGKHDVIASTDGNVFINDSGHPMLTQVTGAGCLLGSVITACLVAGMEANKAESHALSLAEYAHAAVQFYGLAAEAAIQQTGVLGPGTFASHFLDALQGEFL